MKKALIAISISAIFLATTATSVLANMPSAEQIEKKLNAKLSRHLQKNVQLEFIQTARQGMIEPIQGQPNNYKITLNDLNRYVIYFSDRPEHITGMVPVKDFFKVWSKGKNNFDKISPNAVLESEVLPSDSHGFYTFEISNPKFDAAKNTMTYDAKLLSKEPITHKSIGFTTLFIDDFDIGGTWHGHIPG